MKQNIQHLDLNNNLNTNVSAQVENLTQFLSENATKVFGKKLKIVDNNNKNYNKKSSNRPKWFDENCYTAKQEFKKARNIFTKSKTDETRTSFVKTRTKYNRARQVAKRRFKINEGQRLENIVKSQPRNFWKSLKKCYTKPQNKNNDVKLDNLYDHFNNLLGQDPEIIVQ